MRRWKKLVEFKETSKKIIALNETLIIELFREKEAEVCAGKLENLAPLNLMQDLVDSFGFVDLG